MIVGLFHSSKPMENLLLNINSVTRLCLYSPQLSQTTLITLRQICKKHWLVADANLGPCQTAMLELVNLLRWSFFVKIGNGLVDICFHQKTPSKIFDKIPNTLSNTS